jgi:glutamate dehydrogenase/leucine dehydrogenase
MLSAREAAKHLGFDLKGATAAVQGFGNVGSVSAHLLAREGVRIVGITDWKGGVFNADGLDIPALMDYVAKNPERTVDGFPGGQPLAPERIFGLDVDMLIPAALENQVTAANAGGIKARLIVEGANGPTLPDADKALYERGVMVVPDILANGGGVTVSYFEWVQNRYGYYWREQEVNERLEASMCEAFEAVLRTSLKYKVSMRTAAYMVAIDRVATVTRMRGMYA